jgi:hypothetical protein
MLKKFPALSPATIRAHGDEGRNSTLASAAAWNFVMANKNMSDASATWLLHSVCNGQPPL